jgi:hypothetical protein
MEIPGRHAEEDTTTNRDPEAVNAGTRHVSGQQEL